ncbi:hypothetical protein MSIMFI_00652 [Mycobacterium simulans]|nr:hypothetical protein MSIMFI_00652 [Mycobacterium simulans]
MFPAPLGSAVPVARRPLLANGTATDLAADAVEARLCGTDNGPSDAALPTSTDTTDIDPPSTKSSVFTSLIMCAAKVASELAGDRRRHRRRERDFECPSSRAYLGRRVLSSCRSGIHPRQVGLTQPR